MRTKIAIVGAGIIGLSCGVRLLEQGHDVTVFARDFDLDLASRAAPAIWMPYKASPLDSVMRWAKQSIIIYSAFPKSAGIHTLVFKDFLHDENIQPLWTHILDQYELIPEEDLPKNYNKGYLTKTYRIDSHVFMDFIFLEFKRLGGKVIQKVFSKLEDVDNEFPIIVNCTGLGSYNLVPDNEIFPIRGQYLLCEKPSDVKDITFATLDENNYILIVPRVNDCYLGGTTNYRDWNKELDEETSKNIINNALEFEPSLRKMKILSEHVGLRPARSAIRLEADVLTDGRRVIHNYGHGGSGFTIAWGCAEEVLGLVKKF